MIWLKLELSKYFGYFALVFMSAGRIVFAKYLDTCPFAAPIIYPLICTQIYSKLVNVILVLMSQIAVNKYVYEGYGVTKEGEKANLDV